MALLKNLLARLKHKIKPNYKRGVFYQVILIKSDMPAFEILVGPNRNAQFTFNDIHMDDDGKCDISITRFPGPYATNNEINEVFIDFLTDTVDNHNQLKQEVINDNTEDSRTDFAEEPTQERGIHQKGSSIPKE